MSHWGRAMTALAVVASVALGGALLQAPPASASSAGAEVAERSSAVSVYGHYRTPWSTDGSVYRVRTDGTVRKLTREQWVDAGRPTVEVAPVTYARTSWSRTVYGLITWPHKDGDTAVDRVVTLSRSALDRAGSPRPRVLGHVPTTTYFRYLSGPSDLYARTPDGAAKLLTPAQRAAAGSPKAAAVKPGGYFRAAWSSRIHFVTPRGARVVISADEYARRGEPHVAIAPTVYARTPWAPAVHALITWPQSSTDRSVDQVVRMTRDDLRRAGRPGLTTRYRIPGDAFVRLTTGRTIFHRVGGTLTPVSAAQWRAADTPTVTEVRPGKPLYVRDILLVNKSHPLPSSFGNGLRPELTRAWSRMRADARAQGISLTIISGFRSYASQQSVFASKVRQHGRAEAERRSARPGHSEHQTGLAIDLNSISQSWGETRAGRWVAANAHRYGFIVRYPKGKEHITGYRWEPWHLRHVGVPVATHLKKTGKTLDEYLGVRSRY